MDTFKSKRYQKLKKIESANERLQEKEKNRACQRSDSGLFDVILEEELNRLDQSVQLSLLDLNKSFGLATTSSRVDNFSLETTPSTSSEASSQINPGQQNTFLDYDMEGNVKIK